MAEICATCGLPQEICVCEDLAREQQSVKIKIEKRRYGKIVSILEGLGNDIDIDDLCKKLKTKCATGGTKKGNDIVLQGNHIKKVKMVLGDLGFPMEVV